MNDWIKRQIRIVLEDDNELMAAALRGDLDEEQKQVNRELSRKHHRILEMLGSGVRLSQDDLQLIRDANDIHYNDMNNLGGHHAQAVLLEQWLDRMCDLSRQAVGVFEQFLCDDSNASSEARQAAETLRHETTPDCSDDSDFDENGRCRKCGSLVSFANVTGRRIGKDGRGRGHRGKEFWSHYSDEKS
ncbi:MAG: hypothetical protein IH624_13860 [Phycisphaerae bacterium]|nr:hypothetical protein [Phycisphaerae bacterium]